MSAGQSGQGFLRMDKAPLVDSEVAKHTDRVLLDDPSLITVTHTPNGITTHLVSAETEAPTVRMEQGLVITKHVTADYGILLAVLGGPAVVEIALHSTREQRDRYARAVDAVDAETARNAATAIRDSALAFAQIFGVGTEPEDGPPS